MARRTALPKLGELELAVLEHLWRVDEADVGAAHAAVGKSRGITPNTIGSALERLHRKNLARRHKVSHAYVYASAIGRGEFAARRVIEAAGGAKALANMGVLSAFVDAVADIDEAALDRLQELIAQKREDRSGE